MGLSDVWTGHTLEQYCRVEAIDYKWLTKAQIQYGTPEKTTKAKAARRNNTKTFDMIQQNHNFFVKINFSQLATD